MARASLTRAVSFPAGHRYWVPGWDESTNRARFGECAGQSVHGHNYRCEVSVGGEIDQSTGMLVDLVELDAVLEEHVLEPMDHAFLNDLPEFGEDGGLPTTENLARVIWERLAGELPGGCDLVRVRVWEDRDLWSDYTGD